MSACPGEAAYPHLFSPIRINRVTLRNRLAHAATVEVYEIPEGITSKRLVYYLRERARGGVGLIITGNRMVHPHSQGPMRGYNFAYRREIVARDRVLTAVVHDFDTKIFAQLNHLGPFANPAATDDWRVLLAPSAVKSPGRAETPKAMEPEDMDEVAAYWAVSAAHARDAGFDGVELHFANGHLIHAFMSEIYNKRDDAWGGPLENRLRYPLAVLGQVRERVGRDFVVGVRLPLEEMVPGGKGADHWAEVARLFERTGLIDFVGLTSGTHSSPPWQVPPGDVPADFFIEAGARVKAALENVPLMVAGMLADPRVAEDVLASGKGDIIGISRGLLADPELVAKIREGREHEIVRCIRCNQGCIARVFKGAPITCTLNPAAGREERLGADTLRRATKPARWIVVGGGPAGMKAAKVLAQRGHGVTLLEKSDRLGGQVNLLLKTPFRENYRPLIEDLERQILKLGVDVRLRSEATAESVLASGVGRIVVATGSEPLRTGCSPAAPFVERIPGVDQDHVLTVFDVLTAPERIAKTVLVIDDDGTRYAAGTAEFLLDRGKKVHVVTRFPALAPALAETLELPLVYRRLFTKGLTFTANHWVRSIDGDHVRLYHLSTGEETVLSGFESIVLATGHRANDALYFALRGRVPVLYRIGDCLAPRQIDQAIYEGELAGREILQSPDRYIHTGELERWDAGVRRALRGNASRRSALRRGPAD